MLKLCILAKKKSVECLSKMSYNTVYIVYLRLYNTKLKTIQYKVQYKA